MFSRFFTEFLNVYKDLKANNMILKRDQKGIFFFQKIELYFLFEPLTICFKGIFTHLLNEHKNLEAKSMDFQKGSKRHFFFSANYKNLR